MIFPRGIIITDSTDKCKKNRYNEIIEAEINKFHNTKFLFIDSNFGVKKKNVAHIKYDYKEEIKKVVETLEKNSLNKKYVFLSTRKIEGVEGKYKYFEKLLKQNNYKWIHISHKNIFQKLNFYKKNMTGRIYSY